MNSAVERSLQSKHMNSIDSKPNFGFCMDFFTFRSYKLFHKKQHDKLYRRENENHVEIEDVAARNVYSLITD